MSEIRSVVPEVQSVRIPCEHCGHDDWRTKWQAEHQFKCWECGKVSGKRITEESKA